MPVPGRIISSREQLEEILDLPGGGGTAAESKFPLRVPMSYARRIRAGDSSDPLLRQVLPLAAEDEEPPGYSTNPLGESQELPGMLHKYRNRVLLIVTGSCPIHCRYCFRRHFPYDTVGHLEPALDHIAADNDIHEVILSGGDPLSLGNNKLGRIISRLEAVKHVSRLRVHSRMPVAMPERIDAELVAMLRGLAKPLVLVIHCNHPGEIDAEVEQCLRQLQDARVTLLNQAVLLRGVNDNLPVQRELWQKLFATGVMPYYLHLLDKVQGAGHFAVGEGRGRRLIAALRACLPGYLVPRLAREVPDACSKHILA